ncbi:MAG: hypothetical protein FWE22_07080 [Firmicutes bacterium]|nr:hypothetical protein [Bacillota bacterium]
MAKSQGYEFLKVDYIVSLILAIIPITGWVCGIIERFTRKAFLTGILNIFFGFVFWIIGLVDMIINKKITWLVI